ncbi:MAG: glycosyltransferase family 2 protein [Vulcanimicrobiaceae bacterium]
MSTSDAFAVAQGLLGARAFARMIATRGGRPVARTSVVPRDAGTVAALVPVLDECERLGPCLEGLMAAPDALAAIVVVDGGSTDGTQALVRGYAARDPRIRLVDASPVPPDWNGKSWNLACGLAATAPEATWILTLDADVRPRPELLPSLLAHAAAHRLDAFSAAPQLSLSGALESVFHPAFLATLVYRYGLPGNVATRPQDVQANGQCFLVRRELAVSTDAFTAARTSRCDDVTIARHLVRAGARLGFYEGAELATVRMYDSANDCWANWPRSLPLRDGSTTLLRLAIDLATVLAVQALPLGAVLATLVWRRPTSSLFFRINLALAVARLGVLAGTRRAYGAVPPAYWLAALADLPCALRLVQSSLARRHTWRGRTLVAEGTAR